MCHGDGIQGWSGESEHLNYGEIERRRKEKVDKLAYRLLEEREKANKSIEEELQRLFDEERSLVEDVSTDVLFEEAQGHGSAALGDPGPSTDIQNETTETQTPCLTNIPFSDELVSRFILSRAYVSIEENIGREKLVMPKIVQTQTKIQINKRLTQVSGRTGQVKKIFNVLEEYSHSYVFIETFVLKIIEQGRLQVSSCPGSYREFAELFCRFYSPELMEYFRVILFTKDASASTIKGIYGIYFGVLEIQENSDEAWFFIASVLNSRQNELSCYVVECFFSILGDLLFRVCRTPFFKLVEYVKKYYFAEMSNEPCRIRLSSIFARYGM
ncbi:nucleoporin Gle1 [Encephalitozoon cuniculi]|nr:nucleoporin Gle1 [Encephalitozoon cuniculi]